MTLSVCTVILPIIGRFPVPLVDGSSAISLQGAVDDFDAELSQLPAPTVCADREAGEAAATYGHLEQSLCLLTWLCYSRGILVAVESCDVP